MDPYSAEGSVDNASQSHSATKVFSDAELNSMIDHLTELKREKETVTRERSVTAKTKKSDKRSLSDSRSRYMSSLPSSKRKPSKSSAKSSSSSNRITAKKKTPVVSSRTPSSKGTTDQQKEVTIYPIDRCSLLDDYELMNRIIVKPDMVCLVISS